jgi:hypothetical protein
MNVIVSNRLESVLTGLNVEVIKALRGEFEPDELIGTFSNFFFARMILDVTALKNSNDIVTYQKLSIGLPVDKIILVIPADSDVAAGPFLSKLISLGYYNFTTNTEGVQYLVSTPNTYKDVAHLHTVEATNVSNTIITSDGHAVSTGSRIIGIKNITEHAGATTLIYMLKKELEENGFVVQAFEVNKRDFIFYNDKTMISSSKETIATDLLKAKDANFILIDINDGDENLCDEVLYLLEASIIKLNKLLLKDRAMFSKLTNKKLLLNKCVLSKSDCDNFQAEAGINFYYVMPPLNDRERSEYLTRLLGVMGILKLSSASGSGHKGGLFSSIFK